MEAFTTFTDAQVFEPMKTLNWVQVTPSKSMETLKPSPHRNRIVVGTAGLGQEAWDPPEA